MIADVIQTKLMSIEEKVLKRPDYAQWMRTKHPESPAGTRINCLIVLFDLKPYQVLCRGCSRLARKAVVERGLASHLSFLCDDNCQNDYGIRNGTLCVLPNYIHALCYVEFECDGSKVAQRSIIREMAEAKGLPKQTGKAGAAKFFAPGMPTRPLDWWG